MQVLNARFSNVFLIVQLLIVVEAAAVLAMLTEVLIVIIAENVVNERST